MLSFWFAYYPCQLVLDCAFILWNYISLWNTLKYYEVPVTDAIMKRNYETL